MGWRQEEGLALEVLGEIALAEGAYDTARDYLQESLGILRSTGQLEQSEVYAVLGFAYLGLNQIPSAVRHLVEALESAPQIPTIFPIISALPGIALLLADQGQVMEAVELYALASRYPRVANSRWFEDIAGHRIADLARTLPPEEAAAAKVRGQRLDLEETAAKYLAALRAMNNSA